MPTSTFNHSPEALKAFIIKEAKSEGFDVVGFTHPDRIKAASQRYLEALEQGYHASMAWLKDSAERRQHPRALWPEVNTIIMLGMNYGPKTNPALNSQYKTTGNISVYARNRDYHDVMKGRLKQIAGRFHARTKSDVKVFVDTAPILEKPLAGSAGLGWQGKHSNLVNQQFGSWLFLGAIFTTAILPYDESVPDHCGSCKACLLSCPTDAFAAPYKLDANRCISYLTIEHHGHIATEFRAAMGNRIYGCDECLAACPWNKFAQIGRETKLQAKEALNAPPLQTLLALDDGAFRQFFSASPIKRIGRNRFIRNCLIAAGNSQEPSLVADITPHLNDGDGVIRAMAVWALGRLLAKPQFVALRAKYLKNEQDEYVLAEWKGL